MEISKGQILEVIKNCIRPEDIERSFIYWYKKTLKQGEDFRAGLQTFTMPFEGTIVFVDLAPGANWAHPCLYLFIENKTLTANISKGSFPPSMDESPGTFIILLRRGKKPAHEGDFGVFDE